MTRTRSVGVGRSGFTLLEVVIALVIGGMTIATSATLFLELTALRQGLGRTAEVHDRRVNGLEWLTLLCENADPELSGGPALSGTAERATLSSWCESAEGWLVPCAVELGFVVSAEGTTLTLRIDRDRERHPTLSRDTVVVLRGATGKFVYLQDPGSGGRWVPGWDRLTPPPAIGVVIDGDTLLFRVGHRE